MVHWHRRGSGVPKVDRLIRILGSPAKHLSVVWVAWIMQSLIHWFSINGSVIAVLVTVCVAVLLVCCLGCSNCPSRDKDDLFRRHEL